MYLAAAGHMMTFQLVHQRALTMPPPPSAVELIQVVLSLCKQEQDKREARYSSTAGKYSLQQYYVHGTLFGVMYGS